MFFTFHNILFLWQNRSNPSNKENFIIYIISMSLQTDLTRVYVGEV